MSVIRKFFSAPWVIFLVVGGLVYALYPNSVEKPLIHVTRSQWDTYLDTYLKQFRMPPSAELEQRLLDQLISEEVLLQLALSMDYQYLPVVQDRLKKLGGFLEEDNAELPADEVLIERAIDLGLLQSDPVIRRYLVSVMERALIASVPIDISEQEVSRYYEEHMQEFVQPSRLDITHVFFSEDAGRTQEYAAAARERLLASADMDRDQQLRLGDVFYSGHQFAGKNETQLASIFGAEFAREVFESEADQWSNPVRSAYGWHLVWPHNIQLPVTPPVAEVQDKILARIKQDKEKQVLKQQIEKLRQDYEIIVDVNGDAGAAS
jgi:parvulin-like peptidyl-prolyl isomerase